MNFLNDAVTIKVPFTHAISQSDFALRFQSLSLPWPLKTHQTVIMYFAVAKACIKRNANLDCEIACVNAPEGGSGWLEKRKSKITPVSRTFKCERCV
jgi:hypothetical protein